MVFATSSSLFAESESSVVVADKAPTFALQFEDTEAEPDWKPVNDGVMGGLSEGAGRMEDGALIFEGNLSLANNGGFSSVRTTRGQYDFTGAEGLTLRVRGDGRSYQLRLATDARHRGSLVSYQGKFDTEEGQWTEVNIPFEVMKPSWRGRMLSGHILDVSKVSQLGVLIGDKKEGPFRLEVDWIKTYPATS